jgi:hypothetical protein
MGTRDIGSFGSGSRTRILDVVIGGFSFFDMLSIDGTRS